MLMCSVEGCDVKAHGKGLCNTHYNSHLRAKRKAEKEGKPIERKVCVEPNCNETQFKSYRCKPHSREYINKYSREYRQAREVEDDGIDYEDFWLWVKNYLKL